MFGATFPELANVSGETKPAVVMEPPDPPPTQQVTDPVTGSPGGGTSNKDHDTGG